MKTQTFTLHTERQGYYNITSTVRKVIAESGVQSGLCVVFCPHTTGAITINENADPDVRTDLAKTLDHLVKEDEPYYRHTIEGADDMPAHTKSSLMGVSLTIPITDGRPNLGIWQGIYLCEFRNNGGPRQVVATVYG